MSKRGRVMHMVRHTLHVLFPTLHGWWGKSWMGKIASVLATPAVRKQDSRNPVSPFTAEHVSMSPPCSTEAAKPT